MRALMRHCLAPLTIAAALLSAGAPVAHLAAGPAHPGVVACPAGTNWDVTLQKCA